MIVHTDDAKILLLRRHSPFDFWQSVTGSLDTSEEPYDAAQRELSEETGLKDEGDLVESGVSRQFTIDPRWLDRYPPGVTENTEYEWRYRLPKTMDIRINREEHSTYCWLPLEEAIDTVWSWTNKAALRDLQANMQ